MAPDRSLTRAQFTAILVRALGLEPDPSRGNDFSDVAAGEWYVGSVGTAVQAGIVKGYEDRTFRPNATITREEMVVMIERAMRFAGYEKTLSQAEQDRIIDRFDDAEHIHNWAREAAALAADTGIVQGMTPQSFVPREMATRAQCAVIVERMLQVIGFMNH